jgi:6-pyruvoyltetrahydropterin/6-carboxytetrahydropterin synthase
MQKQTIKIKHNIEVAHRLSLLPGKCQNIHGHSMWVTAEFTGILDSRGILLGLDYGTIKAVFRGYLDDTFDHHLLLNQEDPLAKILGAELLPGVEYTQGDPTTENLARWIGQWSRLAFETPGLQRVHIEVWETGTNAATWEDQL